MLTGYRKKLLKEVVSYYIDNTGNSSQKFIAEAGRNSRRTDFESMEYSVWLAVKCLKLLESHDICLSDCLNFNDLALQMKRDKRGMNVSPLWKRNIADYIKESDIQRFELFELSDKDSELNYLDLDKQVSFCSDFEGDENFFNLFDFDFDNRPLFDKLPLRVQRAINMKLPLFINFNPYLERDKKLDNLYDEMRTYGLSGKKIINNIYGCIFKVMRFCELYDLPEVRIGFFSPLNMFCEEKDYLDFYSMFKERFKFNSGICLNPKSVGAKDKTDYIGYTIWDLNSDNSNKPVLLDEYVEHTSNTIVRRSPKLFRGKKDTLYNWEMSSINPSGTYDIVPKYSSIQIPSGESEERHINVLGYQANTNILLLSYRRVGIYSVPIGICSPITLTSIFNSVASYTVRSLIGQDVKVPITLNSPDMSVDGYNKWLANAFIYFIFGPTNMTKSYREKDFTLLNRMFPLKISDVKSIITDENIMNDLRQNGADNVMFLKIIDSVFNDLDKPAINLFSFCKQKIISSLSGKYRENYGYKDSLVAWDASFYQIRQMDNLFTQKDEETYSYLVSQLQDYLNDGIYKFGFVSE